MVSIPPLVILHIAGIVPKYENLIFSDTYILPGFIRGKNNCTKLKLFCEVVQIFYFSSESRYLQTLQIYMKQG